MALTMSRGNMVATCDGCLAKLGMQVRTWQQGIAEMKAKGWVIKRVYDNWKHGCPECVAFQQQKYEPAPAIPAKPEQKGYNPNMSLTFRIAQVTGGQGRLVMPDLSRFQK